jgi:hypothetical protein
MESRMTMSPEWEEARRIGLKKYWDGIRASGVDPRGISVRVRCVETGEVFYSCAEVARILGVSTGLISNVLAGRRKTARGFHFERVGR